MVPERGRGVRLKASSPTCEMVPSCMRSAQPFLTASTNPPNAFEKILEALACSDERCETVSSRLASGPARFLRGTPANLRSERKIFSCIAEAIGNKGAFWQASLLQQSGSVHTSAASGMRKRRRLLSCPNRSVHRCRQCTTRNRCRGIPWIQDGRF